MRNAASFLLEEAQTITDRAKAQGRGLTAHEKETVERHLDRVREIRENDELADLVAKGNGSTAHSERSGGKTSGALTFDAAELAAFKTAVANGQPAGLKATVTVAGGAIAPQYSNARAITVAREQFRVRGLFPTEQMTAPSVLYRSITTGAAQAAAVAEGGLKPEATIAATQVEAVARKIAVWLPVSDEALADGGERFVDELVSELTRDMLRAENAQLLSGSGVAPNLTGVLNTTGIQTRARDSVGGESNLDALIKATTQLRTVAFVQPTDVVLHPSNFEVIRLAKASDGAYLLGNPLAEGQPTILGARIHLTTDIPAGTGLVMNSAEAATVFVREDVRVDFGLNADMFTRNLQAIRAEERLAFAVKRPAAVVRVTGLV